MADKHQCSVEIAKLFKEFTEEQVDDIRKMLQRRAAQRRSRMQGVDADAELVAAAAELVEERKIAAILAKRNAYMNLQRRLQLGAYIQRTFPDRPQDGIKAVLAGINLGRKGTRKSVAARQSSLVNQYVGRFMVDIKRTGHFEEFVKGVYDADIVRAMFAKANPDTPIDDIPAPARALADVIEQYHETARVDANHAGAWIGRVPGYIKQSHSPYKIKKVSFDEWKRDFLASFDTDKMLDELGGDVDLNSFLKSTYEALRSGVHLRHSADINTGGVPVGMKNIAKRMSKHRLFHAIDADAWLKYHQKYGMHKTVAATVVHTLDLSARQTALMQVLGPNAEATLEWLMDTGQRMFAKNNPNADRSLFSDEVASIKRIFRNLDGSTKMPGRHMFAQFGQGVRALNVASKLGGVVISSITDLVTYANGIRYEGGSLFSGYAEALKALSEGRGDADRIELASSLGVAIDGWRGAILTRFSTADDDIPGVMSNLMALTFKITGQSWWTDTLRVGFAQGLSHRMALHRTKSWAELPEELQRNYGFYNIGEKEWEVIRNAEVQTIDGVDFLTPESVRFADVDAMVGDRLREVNDKFLEDFAAEAKRLRELGDKDLASIAKHRERLEEIKKRTATQMADIRTKIEGEQEGLLDVFLALEAKIQAHIDKAEAVAGIDAATSTFNSQAQIRTYLERVEEGADVDNVNPRRSIGDLADRELDRLSTTRGNQGADLGARRSRAEQRIRDAEKRLNDKVSALDEKLQGKESTLRERIGKAEQALIEFIERTDERIADRQRRIARMHELVGYRIERIRREARQELEASLASYFQDQTDFAVVNPDARTEAITNWGTQRGTVGGEIARFFWQFKSFPLAILQRPIERELFSRGADIGSGGSHLGTTAVNAVRALASGNGAFGGIATLIANLTVLGYMAMSLKDIAKNRQPRDPMALNTWEAAFLQGGGLGIYGDFLFGQATRYGHSPLATIAGPTFGQFEDVADIYFRARDGDPVAGKAFDTVLNNTPFVNLFYLRTALDFAILHRIREGLNPGYLSRMERRIQEENHQKFIVNPKQYIPHGGGSIGEAASSTETVVDDIVGWRGDR